MNDQQSYYETMYILRPDIAEDEVTNHIDKYNKLLEEFGGTILDSQMRGKRRLAYQISKHREGIYVQLSHQGDGQHIFKIEKAMRLSEDVIRYMTVKQEGTLPTPRADSKSSSQAEDKDNPETKVESKEKQSVVSENSPTSGENDTATKVESKEKQSVVSENTPTSGENDTVTKVEPKEKQPTLSPGTATSGKNKNVTKENAES